MTLPKYPLIGLFLLFQASSSYSQVLDFIDIHLTIREKVGDQNHILPNAKLNISDVGEVSTDGQGQYSYTYAVRNQVDPEISISLLSAKHKLLKPLDGAIMVDPTKDELHIDFLVVNMAEESEEFRKKVRELESRISRLQQKDQLSKRQLFRLNNTLLDTILYYENLRSEMEEQINQARDLNTQQQETIEKQQAQIATLEEKVNTLTDELTEALEARYLRQNEYYKDIAANLIGYVRSAKDIEEHLPRVRSYCRTNDFRSMDRDARLYEKYFVEISDREQDFLQGVDRYWDNKAIDKELEDVFELLLKGIHLTQIRPTVNEVFDLVSKGKYGKAQKLAEDSHENIALNIRDLEQKINRILVKMRNN